MTKTQKEERAEAILRLRELLPPGSTVYTVLKHVSRSGMQREIACYAIIEGRPQWLSGYIGKAMDYAKLGERDGNKVSGCGMDMGFHIVNSLSATLYPDGFGCLGDGCPAADHSNGDRNYTPHGVVTGCQIGSKPCTCHDESAWRQGSYVDGCSDCGCHRANHWHTKHQGAYALKHSWM